MKLAIVIATYQRNDNTTPIYLTRALNAIKNQTYQEYKVFLIGDKYNDSDEFYKLATKTLPADKIYYENLPVAIERDRYPHGGTPLWRCGGANARNHGIDIAISNGYDYVCHLDHDDYWNTNHLELISTVIKHDPNFAFIHTQSTYMNSILPNTEQSSTVVEQLPSPGQLIHSSVCINHKLITLRYRDTFHDTGNPNASDADLWERLSAVIIDNNYKSYYIPLLTCYHDEENH
jgi:glycosyltransferase involved in cell wall biosynthesis